MLNYFFSTNTIKKLNFEEMQEIIRGDNSPHSLKIILINILPINQQYCLIPTTIPAIEEEKIINDIIENVEMRKYHIVLYGTNAGEIDELEKKTKILQGSGFSLVSYYLGGLFEWLLLQDIYGEENFPTTSKELDIFKYRMKRAVSEVKTKTFLLL